LDNIKRSYLASGELARLVAAGIRGVTANSTIFEHAVAGSADYDEQFRALTERNVGVEDAYWDLVIDDIENALRILRPVFDESAAADGFASVELPPSLAHDTDGSILTARSLHDQIREPNLLVKIPATAEGIPAIRQMISEGRSINITLIFSLERYEEVIEAYLSGLEAYSGELAHVHSVASFFVSRVDAEVDRRLDQIAADEAQALRGRAAVAQAKLAYRLFRQRFSGPRWEALAAGGARLQRPLWASTSTKNPAYPDTLYVDHLIGPDTVSTMPEQTIAAFEDHGTLRRTVDAGVDEAKDVLHRLERLGVDMGHVGETLEGQGVAGFAESYDRLLAALAVKAGKFASHH
jgi:transaldolase